MRILWIVLLTGLVACSETPVDIESDRPIDEPGELAEGRVSSTLFTTQSDMPLAEMLASSGKHQLTPNNSGFELSGNYRLAISGDMEASNIEVRRDGRAISPIEYVKHNRTTIRYGQSAASATSKPTLPGFRHIFTELRDEVELAYLNGFVTGSLSKDGNVDLVETMKEDVELIIAEFERDGATVERISPYVLRIRMRSSRGEDVERIVNLERPLDINVSYFQNGNRTHEHIASVESGSSVAYVKSYNHGSKDHLVSIIEVGSNKNNN